VPIIVGHRIWSFYFSKFKKKKFTTKVMYLHKRLDFSLFLHLGSMLFKKKGEFLKVLDHILNRGANNCGGHCMWLIWVVVLEYTFLHTTSSYYFLIYLCTLTLSHDLKPFKNSRVHIIYILFQSFWLTYNVRHKNMTNLFLSFFNIFRHINI